MFRIEKVKGSVDVSVPIYVIDSSDGTPETGYTHASTGIDLWYRREGGAEVAITEAALAAWNSAHSDGGVEHGADGRGRLDLPDAACAVGTDGATYVEYGGHIDGMIVIGGVVELVQETALSGLFSGTHSTTSADLGSNAPANSIIGMSLYFPTVKQSRVVETYNTGTGVAGWTTALAAAPQDNEPWVLFTTPPIDAVTVAAIQSGLSTLDASAVRSALGMASPDLDTQLDTIAAYVDTEIASIISDLTAVLLDTGTTLDGKINAIQAVTDLLPDAGALSSLATSAEIAALDTVVDRVEADTQNIQSRLPASLNNGAIPADVQRINDVEITGDGSTTPFDVV